MKVEISNENIWLFKYAENLTMKDTLLLMEAFRRKHFLKSSDWLGLGMPSQYKSKYFRTHDGSMTPKINHWWVLTQAGKEMMDKLEKMFIVPEDAGPSHPINSLLFSLGS